MGPPRTILDFAARALAPAAGRRVILSAAGNPDREHTAGELLRDAEAVSRALGAAGLAQGELVLLEGLAAGRFVTACLAVWSRDAVVLPADPSTAPGEMAALCTAFTPRLSLCAGDGPGGLVIAPARMALRFEPPAGTALIKLTSGSTGRPRGVAVTADQLLADGRHIIEAMGVRPDDVNVSAVPLSHSYGQGSLLMPLLIQGTAMLVADPRHAESFARTLSAEAPMVFPGVPMLFGMLSRPDAPPVAARGLRLCLSAGAPLTSATARAFRERVGQPVRAFYGTSETGGIAFDASPEGDAAERDEGAVGSPLPGVEITVDPGSGRVVVRGDAVALGYTGTSEAGGPGRFEQGAFLTGDLGCWTGMRASNGAGALRLTGRVGDVVNVAGRKVDPREVERILLALEGVRDAVVMGVPDAARGESLAACLEADAGVTREGVMARLRSELAPHKLPRRIVFLDRLPRNERGKTDRDALRRSLRDAGA